MTTEEKQAWGLVGFGAVVIILLLLDWGDTNYVVDAGAPGVTFPNFDPITFQLTNVPPGGYPFYLNLSQPAGPDSFNYQGGNPCACGCEGASEIVAADLSAQIGQLNATIRNATISATKSYFSELPGSAYWTTNDTQISVFNGLVGLPPPPYGS